MKEGSKCWNQALAKVRKFVAKTYSDLDGDIRQLSLYKCTEPERQALIYAKERMGGVLTQLDRLKDEVK